MSGYDFQSSDPYTDASFGADVAGIWNAVNDSVSITADIIQWGTEYQASPQSRVTFLNDTWPDIQAGYDKSVGILRDLKTQRDVAQGWIDNPDSWWNKDLGHAKDPLWMAGQKKIVADYPANVKWYSYEQPPGFDNMSGLATGYLDNNSGHLRAYRDAMRTYIASTLAMSGLGILWVGQFASVMPLDRMLDQDRLSQAWPGDPEAAQGRVPAGLRGDILSQAMSAANGGLIALDTPVPWWVLGFNKDEFREFYNADPRALPSYRTLTILSRARDARLAAAAGLS